MENKNKKSLIIVGPREFIILLMEMIKEYGKEETKQKLCAIVDGL